jgi:hypothetical protein
MKQPHEKTFGFEYEHDGKRYATHVVALSREEATGRLASLAGAQCVGELYQEEDTTGETYLSST